MVKIKKLIYLILLLILINISLALRLNEVMYHPNQCSYTDCEWIELYNNGTSTIDLTNWKIDNYNFDDVNISVGGYLIIARELIDGGDADNESFEYYWGNDDGVWNSSDGNYTAVDGYFSLSDTEDIINLSNGTYSVILSYDDSLGADGDGNSLQLINETWYASSPTPGYENFFNGTQEQQQQQDENLTFTISINKEQFEIGDELIINGNFTTYNLPIDGSLIIKIGKEKPEGGFEYLDENILINQDITLNAGSVTTLNDLFGEVKWIIPSVFTGKYKVYAPFSSEIQNRRPSKTFDIHGLGNIFIDSWDVDNYNLDLENNNLTASINITNNETSPFLINLSVIVEDLKTVSTGKTDFEYFCNNFSILNLSSITKQCNFILPNDTITNGTLEFDIYSKIVFIYDNTTIVKKSEQKEINITGLEDLGDPTLEILSDNLTASFGDFTSVFVKYNTNNYNFPLRFIAYAYTPKRISMDLNTDTIYKKFCEVNTAVELQNLERGKTIYLSLPLFIKKNCDNDYQQGTYESFARICEFKNEWDYMSPTNDFKKKFDLIISGNNNANCPITKYKSSGSSGEKTTTTSKPLYEIISIPATVNLNQDFTSKIRLNNNDKTDNEYSVWSYVYRGNKVYSVGEREQNLQELSINTGSSSLIELKNIPLEEGDFNFKIKIRKNDQKTTKDITKEIKVISLKEEKEITKFKTEEEKEESKTSPIKNIFKKEPGTVYLSSSAKARKLAPSFILFLLSFLSISFLWKKTI